MLENFSSQYEIQNETTNEQISILPSRAKRVVISVFGLGFIGLEKAIGRTIYFVMKKK